MVRIAVVLTDLFVIIRFVHSGGGGSGASYVCASAVPRPEFQEACTCTHACTCAERTKHARVCRRTATCERQSVCVHEESQSKKQQLSTQPSVRLHALRCAYHCLIGRPTPFYHPIESNGSKLDGDLDSWTDPGDLLIVMRLLPYALEPQGLADSHLYWHSLLSSGHCLSHGLCHAQVIITPAEQSRHKGNIIDVDVVICRSRALVAVAAAAVVAVVMAVLPTSVDFIDSVQAHLSSSLSLKA